MTDDEHKEPPRPEPDFSIYVTKGVYDINVTYAVMDAYDIATESLDFGSGFLSTEEVGHLRELGRAIGAPPLHYKCGSLNHYGDPLAPPKPCDCGAEAQT